MKVQFGSEKLEQLTSKFIIKLAAYLYDHDFKVISVGDVTVVDVDALNQKTIITFGVFNNKGNVLTVSHAKDMCCSNWELK